MDLYERGMEGATEFPAPNIWLQVRYPIQGEIKEFFADYNQFPNREGSSLMRAGPTTGCCGSRTL